ncbi:MAG: hypothetical protein WDN46_13675 [Methylocella sp.]
MEKNAFWRNFFRRFWLGNRKWSLDRARLLKRGKKLTHFSLRLAFSGAIILGTAGFALADQGQWPMMTSDAGYAEPSIGVVQPDQIYEGRSAFSPTEASAFSQDFNGAGSASDEAAAPEDK